MVADAEALKKKAREALIKPQYNVFDDYWESGCCQWIAKSHKFQHLTFLVITVNAIWIGVDLDHNDAAVLTEAHPVFQVAENAFCTFFFFEVCVRFLAFEKKKNCLRDWWLIFDIILVLIMMAETWILVGVMTVMGMKSASDLGPVSILRVVRMAKMARMARMVRLVRAFPEIVVLIKGIKAAVRSVMTFFVLWIIMVYIYGVVFKQLTAEHDIGKEYFENIPAAMNTLLLRGILPEFAELMDDVAGSDFPWIWPILLSFILLASLTMMNMLVGVLVEVVYVLSAVEKESMLVSHVAQGLRHAMAHLQKDTSVDISHADFRHLLVQPEIASIVQEAGVDVVVLLDQSDIIFESLQQEGGESEMSFEKFIDIVLNMRTTNGATVKDVSQQLRLISRMVKETSAMSEEHLAKLIGAELLRMRAELNTALEHMQKAVAKDTDEDDDDADEDDGGEGDKDKHGGGDEAGDDIQVTTTESFSIKDLQRAED